MFCFIGDNNFHSSMMWQPFPVVPFVCLCSSAAEKRMCPGNTA